MKERTLKVNEMVSYDATHINLQYSEYIYT